GTGDGPAVPGRDPAPQRGARGRRRGPAGGAVASGFAARAGAGEDRRPSRAAHLDPDRRSHARGARVMSPARREIYADHAATTRPAPEVTAAMTPFLGERFGNPSSVHRRGEAAREAIEAARARVAELIGATPEEILLTATGSEANTLALAGTLAAL